MKKFITILAILLLCLPFFSCSGGDKEELGGLIRVSVQRDPKTLDPQVCSDTTAQSILLNLYEGLMRKNADGTLCPGAADNYINKDDRVYTFHIREDLMWSDNETPLTAHDFVFAVIRALTLSPDAKSTQPLYEIKNARAFAEGRCPKEHLGVRADTDKQITFTLEKADARFMELLTLPVFMPCNEAFFNECAGRYGMDGSLILSNGPFRLRRTSGWVHGEYIRLVKNEAYTGDFTAKSSGIHYSVGLPSDALAAVQNQSADLAKVTAEQAAAAKDAGIRTVGFEQTTWGIFINPNKQELKNQKIRESLLLTLKGMSGEKIPVGYEREGNIIPGDCTAAYRSYRETAGPLSYKTAEPKALLSEGLSELSLAKLRSYTLLCPDTYAMRQYANEILARFREQLGVYFNAEYVPLNELNMRIVSGNYELALYNVYAQEESASAFLLGLSDLMKMNVQKEEPAPSSDPEKPPTEEVEKTAYELLLERWETIKKNLSDDDVKAVKKAEQFFIDEGLFLPMFSESTFYAVGENLTGEIVYPFDKGIDFTQAYRKVSK